MKKKEFNVYSPLGSEFMILYHKGEEIARLHWEMLGSGGGEHWAAQKISCMGLIQEGEKFIVNGQEYVAKSKTDAYVTVWRPWEDSLPHCMKPNR